MGISSLISVLERSGRNDGLFQALMLYITRCAEPEADGEIEELDMGEGVGAGWGDDLNLEAAEDGEVDGDEAEEGDEEAEEGEGGWEMEVCKIVSSCLPS